MPEFIERKYVLYDDADFEERRPKHLCIFFIFICMVIIIRRIISIFGWYIPTKLMLMFISIPIMLLCAYYYQPAFMIIYINSCNMMMILMPAIIFHFTYNMDLPMMWKCRYQICINTIRSIVEAIFLILILRQLAGVDYYASITLSFVASIPLPLAILSHLENLGQYAHIAVLLKIETIMSIAIADFVVICTISDEFVIDHMGFYAFLACRHIIGAVLIGILHGKLLVWVLMQTQTESINLLIITLSSMYILYGLIAPQIGSSSDLTTFIAGVIIANEKNKYSVELDKIIAQFWDQIFMITDLFMMGTVSCFLIWYLIDKESYEYKHYMIITYLTSNILRFLTFCVSMPIMKRCGHGINMRSLIVLSTAGIKDSVNLILLQRLYEYQSVEYLIHLGLPLAFLSMVLNASTLPYLLKLMGLSDISITRKTNMNNCMRFVMEKRTRFIAALKLNRYLSDADWKTIQDTTMVVHPYKLNLVEYEHVAIELRLNFCPHCKTEFPMELTKKEKEGTMKEANTRVLKAKQISFIRQFENGMLSKEGITILMRAIELATFAANKLNSETELLNKLATKGSVIRFLAKYLMKAWSDKEATFHPPTVYCRRIAYYIVMHFAFDIVIYATIIIVSIPTILVLTIDEEAVVPYEIYLYVFFSMGNLIFLTECILKILGFSEPKLKHGFRKYFGSAWNVIDFVIVVAAYIDQIIETIDLLMIEVNIQVVRLLRLCRLFRIIRIVRLFRGLQPKLLRYLEGNIDLKMALEYDIAKGMLVALEEVENQLPKLIDDQFIRETIYNNMLAIRQSIHKHLTHIGKDRPWVSVTVKSKQAVRTTLNAIADAINELKFSGYIDIQEHAKLLKSWDESNKVAKRMRVIQRSMPREIFKEVTWLTGDNDLTEFLFKRVEKRSFETDEVVCLKNELFDGVMILVTGILSLKYDPSAVDHVQDLRDYGALPIVDFLASAHFDVAVQDYAVSGNSIGELCYLTNRYYCSTIIANAPSEAYLISADVMDTAIVKYNDPIFGLECQLWKYVTYELAMKILMDTQVYASVQLDQMKIILDRAFVPNIRNFIILRSNDLIEDIILLEGLAADDITKELHIAPCYINRYVRQLNFYKSSTLHFETKISPKVMIIPVKDENEYEIMEKIEDFNELLGYVEYDRLYTETAYNLKRRVKTKADQAKKKQVLQSESSKTSPTKSEKNLIN